MSTAVSAADPLIPHTVNYTVNCTVNRTVVHEVDAV